MFSTSSVSNSFFALTKTLPKDSTVITPSGVQKCLNMFCVYLYFMILSPSFYSYLLTFFFFICKGLEETELDCWAFDACYYYWRRDSCWVCDRLLSLFGLLSSFYLERGLLFWLMSSGSLLNSYSWRFWCFSLVEGKVARFFDIIIIQKKIIPINRILSLNKSFFWTINIESMNF